MKNFVYLVVLLGVVACNAAVGSSTRNIRNQPEKSTAEECKRKYTLTPESVHQIPHAFKRHRISPKLTAPPNELLSVSNFCVSSNSIVSSFLVLTITELFLKVDYANLTKCQPNLGNEVNICNITQAPNIVWNCRKDQLYTLFLIDMHPLGDAQPAQLSEGILWWVVNIPGCEIAKGKSVYEYQPPLPLYGAGHGKYVFLVYEQPERVIDWSEEYQVTAT